MTTNTLDHLTSSSRLLAPFALAMVGANVVMQVAIALTGQAIGLLAGVMTGLIALAYAGFLLRYGSDLGKVRYGQLTAHVITFATVNTGFGLHFFLLAVTGRSMVSASGEALAMDGGWFGAAVAMPALWGVGLVLHALGAVAGRGFEAVR